ncbi:hypothetical protein [Clostridium perfringens]|uniref:hypothetical protein n=1 Tax=Clostridium perfringens TaxID=1502 RepID=UPI000D70D995|nr:hypothetical protein [Clostridium perfringens]MDM0489973.1 hypothetical protein [Clostridium perfringens]MDM0672644.1 hypothetical protein [Clostridium perfringens]PWX52267.1 hypothetical protein CYK61_00750 [Clostridium perfringens]
MQKSTLKGVPISRLRAYIINEKYFFSEIDKYKGTSQKSANKLLNKILTEDEKKMLYEMLNSQEGWYRKQHGYNTIKLKLAALASGFTKKGKISHRNEDKLMLLDLINSIDSDEEKIIISAYLKQTLITFKNLLNNKEKGYISDKIVLYRGIKKFDGKYEASNLESWTSKEKIARRFANPNGYVLKREFELKEIFAYRKSVFKHDKFKDPKVSKFINIEKEFIVEFTDKSSIFVLEKGNNLIEYTDSYLDDNW